MNREQLLAAINTRLTKNKAVNLAIIAGNVDGALDDLLALTFNADKATAFRAAWVLELVEADFPEKFKLVFKLFVQTLMQQTNNSCQRHFTKILMRYTTNKSLVIRKEIFDELSEADDELLIETMFDWLISPRTPVAVRVNCMDILSDMAVRYSWIRNELVHQIEYYLADGSAAIQSRGRRLLKKLDN